jgi:uncharacterized protein (TIGR03435 family)
MGIKLLLPLLVVFALSVVSAQDVKATFDVASVRRQPSLVTPSAPPAGAVASGASNRYLARSATVASLIEFAYQVIDEQLVGGPEWARKEFFEIDARTSRQLSQDEMRPMLQSLLEDRFKLVIHKEQRELPTSEIVLANQDGRLGPKLQQCVDPDKPSVPGPVRVPRGSQVHRLACVPISRLVSAAALILRRPVLDKTGLEGLWTLELVYAVDVDGEAPQFPEALKEQLGLKIESKRSTVDVIVIDAVEHPTEN